MEGTVRQVARGRRQPGEEGTTAQDLQDPVNSNGRDEPKVAAKTGSALKALRIFTVGL